MQAIAVNTTPIPTGMTGTATTVTATPSGEDFLALMMGMLQTDGQPEDAMQSLLDGMLPQSGKNKDTTATTANDYAMQMMAGLFTGLPNGMPNELLNQNPLSYSDGLTTTGNSAMSPAQQAILQLTGQPATATLPNAATLSGQTAPGEQAALNGQTTAPRQTSKVLDSDLQLASATPAGGKAKTLDGDLQLAQSKPAEGTAAQQPHAKLLPPELQLAQQKTASPMTAQAAAPQTKPAATAQTLSTASSATADGKETVELLAAQGTTGSADHAKTDTGDTRQQSFQSELNKLSATVKKTTGDTTEPLDMEALQAAVDSGKYLQASRTAEVSTKSIPSAADLVAQVKTGIVSSLKQDKNEFTIKLKPEGMGEITVKMSETDGKITLSLTTTSQQTQTLLSGEIGNLREALKPYNANIQQIVNQPQTTLQQGMGEHQHNNGSQQRGQQATAYTVWEQPEPAKPEGRSAVLSSVLNAYV
ncbi:MAG: flagellar hook-length control protein FliK [Angelakisella sp.]